MSSSSEEESKKKTATIPEFDPRLAGRPDNHGEFVEEFEDPDEDKKFQTNHKFWTLRKELALFQSIYKLKEYPKLDDKEAWNAVYADLVDEHYPHLIFPGDVHRRAYALLCQHQDSGPEIFDAPK